ncbi:MAG TPA: hypothetical protein VEQ10_06645 [Vicinamibacteria bacterium]|nr:hypothetical protein [Vicinamibacteria bacterium]
MMDAFAPGTPVVLYLHSPREKMFGLLASVDAAGIALRGIDLVAFDDWLRQEARGEEPGLGLVTLFLPMHRVEKLERDETVGGLEGFADRFLRETGRRFEEVATFDAADGPASTRRRPR